MSGIQIMSSFMILCPSPSHVFQSISHSHFACFLKGEILRREVNFLPTSLSEKPHYVKSPFRERQLCELASRTPLGNLSTQWKAGTWVNGSGTPPAHRQVTFCSPLLFISKCLVASGQCQVFCHPGNHALLTKEVAHLCTHLQFFREAFIHSSLPTFVVIYVG